VQPSGITSAAATGPSGGVTLTHRHAMAARKLRSGSHSRYPGDHVLALLARPCESVMQAV
jgi:hypothetical protein